MTKAKIIIALILGVLLVSCDLFPELTLSTSGNILPLPGENQFYAQNMDNDKYYIVSADKLHTGTYCEIWAEIGSGVEKSQAKEIAEKYDTIIRPRVVNEFGMKNLYTNDNGEIIAFNDILDFANYLAGSKNGKLTVLLLDIKDGFKNPQTDSYVAGYFFSGNFLKQGKINSVHYSNARDMIYIDTSPGLSSANIREQTYATFAHELQHLINWVTSVILKRDNMDTWVDEGLSSQAEYLYLERNPSGKLNTFIEDRNGTIARGNNFFVWDNRGKNAILDEYATVYLFFRWLNLHAQDKLSPNNSSRFLYNIITSDNWDYRAVTNVAQTINAEWGTWETLLRTWLAANYYPQNAVYGYKNDPELSNLRVRPVARTTSISLYPGEGVYSEIKNTFTPSKGANIKYAGITGNSGSINTNSPYTQNMLLTFNANTSNSASTETGYLTGTASVVPRTLMPPAPEFTGPHVIDARDLLGRNRNYLDE